MRTEESNPIVYEISDLLELKVDRQFYTTGEKSLDIDCNEGDIFILLYRDKNTRGTIEWTLYHQKSMMTMPEFTEDLLDEVFVKVE